MVNINTGAVALTGTVLVAGVAATLIWKGFIRDQLLYGHGHRQKNTGRQRGIIGSLILLELFIHFIRSSDPFTEFENENPIARFTDIIEQVLRKYNIDATACTQRTLCMTVRDASQNVAKGIGSSSEKIFDGLVR